MHKASHSQQPQQLQQPQRGQKPQQEQSIRLVDMVLPEQCNHHGTLFAGASLAMLDKLAFIAGSKILRAPIVTAAINGIEFLVPTPAGSLVETVGSISHMGRRSITIQTSLITENMHSGERTKALAGEFVMVATEQPEQDRGQLPISPADSVCVAEIVFPSHSNHRGVLHGGPAMAWIAKAGFVAAMRQARMPLVMAGSEKLDFTAPAKTGEVVQVTARVSAVGSRSVTVQVLMVSQSPETGEQRECARTELVFVAIDEQGRSTPLRQQGG